ncbi:hypothetical protein RJ640_008736 [Escallonia rubra]|uniref:Uncharacterized protein n=1 Tax=Escallonia rubra TaxID=112253 RepID=A0AA88R402_9ASTE|nr:hypothetical protein RJ640_008736 [Escallonia rubra]
MPTFTTIALENLLEPRTRDSIQKSDKHAKAEERSKSNRPPPPRRRHVYNITPALYTTPEPTPVVPDYSSDSHSPSPYVFNRKGRGGGRPAKPKVDGVEASKGDGVGEMGEERLVEEDVLGNGNEDRDEVEDDGFFDPRLDSLSVASSSELNDSMRHVENVSLVSNQGDYYDANEGQFHSSLELRAANLTKTSLTDFLSDGSVSNVRSCARRVESELRTTRLSLLEEIERRKTSEDTLALMYSQWQRVCNLLSQARLPFPSPPILDISSIEQFSQEVVVTRFVDEALGRGLAQAEAELAAEVIIESKDLEISRLRDRLQYYEAVNREMVQRNQEVKEIARKERQRTKGRQRWLWGCIGLSITIGASVIAYSCLPQTSRDQEVPPRK